MPIFAVYKTTSDTCGNEDSTFLKYVEAPSKEVVEKHYPSGLFVGFTVLPVVPAEVLSQ